MEEIWKPIDVLDGKYLIYNVSYGTIHERMKQTRDRHKLYGYDDSDGDSIRVYVTMSKALVDECRKHHINVNKVARERAERVLQEYLEKLERKPLKF